MNYRTEFFKKIAQQAQQNTSIAPKFKYSLGPIQKLWQPIDIQIFQKLINILNTSINFLSINKIDMNKIYEGSFNLSVIQEQAIKDFIDFAEYFSDNVVKNTKITNINQKVQIVNTLYTDSTNLQSRLDILTKPIQNQFNGQQLRSEISKLILQLKNRYIK